MLRPPLKPMLAATTSVLPQPSAMRGGCLYQPKFDGYRAIAFHLAGDTPSVVIQSRAGTILTTGFPEIRDALSDLVPPGAVLDGELVVWDGQGVNFSALAGRLGATRKAARLARERPATYMVFDVLAVDGVDLRRYPLAHRLEILAAMSQSWQPPIQVVPTTGEVEVAQVWVRDYATTPGLGIEGVVVKAAADPYSEGRRGWLKYRVRSTHDLVVGAVLGPVAAPHRLVLGYYDRPSSASGGPQPAGSDAAGAAGSDGPSGQDADEIAAETTLRVAGATIPLGAQQARTVGKLITESPVPEQHPWPESMPAGWLGTWAKDTVRLTLAEPTLVVEVSADTAFEHGRWRHQVRFIRARPDKDPATTLRPDASSTPRGN